MLSWKNFILPFRNVFRRLHLECFLIIGRAEEIGFSFVDCAWRRVRHLNFDARQIVVVATNKAGRDAIDLVGCRSRCASRDDQTERATKKSCLKFFIAIQKEKLSPAVIL